MDCKALELQLSQAETECEHGICLCLRCVLFQGDKEKELGLPVSPLMDRQQTGGMTRSQVWQCDLFSLSHSYIISSMLHIICITHKTNECTTPKSTSLHDCEGAAQIRERMLSMHKAFLLTC